jgi:hypothetical protein
MAAEPGFVSVTTFCPPLDPITTAAQVTLAGETVAASMPLAAARAQNSIRTSLARFEVLGPGWNVTAWKLFSSTREKLIPMSFCCRLVAEIRMIFPRIFTK